MPKYYKYIVPPIVLILGALGYLFPFNYFTTGFFFTGFSFLFLLLGLLGLIVISSIYFFKRSENNKKTLIWTATFCLCMFSIIGGSYLFRTYQLPKLFRRDCQKLNTIASALYTYKQDHGMYPDELKKLVQKDYLQHMPVPELMEDPNDWMYRLHREMKTSCAEDLRSGFELSFRKVGGSCWYWTT